MNLRPVWADLRVLLIRVHFFTKSSFETTLRVLQAGLELGIFLPLLPKW